MGSRLRPTLVSLGSPLVLVALTVGASAGQSSPRLPDKAVARSYFTDTKLLTHLGEEVRFFSDVLEDKIVVINGFYTRCEGLSPRQSQVLAGLQDLLGENLGEKVFIVSISVDPRRDTVKDIYDYARKYEARRGWTFLTGEPENVERVNKKLGQHRSQPEDHHGMYLLGNVRTGLWVKVPLHAMSRDLFFHVQRLIEDEGAPPTE